MRNFDKFEAIRFGQKELDGKRKQAILEKVQAENERKLEQRSAMANRSHSQPSKKESLNQMLNEDDEESTDGEKDLAQVTSFL